MNKRTFAFCAALLLHAALTSRAQTTTQTFNLHAGWNSIWLEVEPPDPKPATVFAGLPVTGVWTYFQEQARVEFISDQAEAQFSQPGWLEYFPAVQPEAFLTSLFAIKAGRAYLVKAAAATVLTITGRPAVKASPWVPDSFNLRGFPVNPAALPAFGAYFAGAPAHAGQRVYRLDTAGTWQVAAPGETIGHGVAYWVFARGASNFHGTINLENVPAEGIDFSAQLTGLLALLRNNAAGPSTVTITDTGGALSPLSYPTMAANTITYVPLATPFETTLAAGATAELRLTIRRKDFAAETFSTLLEVKDNRGTRCLVPVTAEKLLTARPSRTASPPVNGVNATLAGLWVGSASVTGVNEVNSATPANVTPARSPFDLRLLVHVTENGAPRLLKEVIQLWQESTFTTDVAGNRVVDKPGRYVLLTREDLVPQFTGTILRNGQAAGRRVSTVDFDFDGGPDNLLTMSGGFGIGQVATANLVLAPALPTNPFQHKYHPDHDNLNATFTAAIDEAYQVTRTIQLTFTPADPGAGAGATDLEYGSSVLGGTYRETLSGLHKRPIVATGTFRLTRISNSPVLNQ